MNSSRKVCSILFLLAFVSPSWAAEPLPISKAVQKALNYSPSIKASKDGERAASEKIGEARSMKGMKVSVSVSDASLNSPMLAFGARLNQGRIDKTDFDPARLNDPNSINNLQVGAQVIFPIYLGGMDYHAVQAAKRGLEATGNDSKRMEEDIIFRAIETYLGVILAREDVQVAQKALDGSRESVRNAQAAMDAQRAVESDLLQAKVQDSQNEETLLRMKNQLALELDRLASIMGEPSAKEYDLNMPFLSQECSACSEEPGKLLTQALARRPDFLKVSSQIQATDHFEKMTRGTTRPHLVLGATAENSRDGFSGDNHGNGMVFARMDWNIADGGEAGHKAQGSRFQQDQLKRMRDALADQIHLEIREAITNINNSLERIRVSRQAVDQSQESLRILRDRYNVGMAIMSDLLGAQNSLLSHQMNHMKALYDYSLSKARLKMALGELDLEHCEILRTPEISSDDGLYGKKLGQP